MNSVIEVCCNEMISKLESNYNRDEFFNSLVKKRLSELSRKEDEELDTILNKLYSELSGGSPYRIKACLNKLQKILHRDRKHMFRIMLEVV